MTETAPSATQATPNAALRFNRSDRGNRQSKAVVAALAKLVTLNPGRELYAATTPIRPTDPDHPALLTVCAICGRRILHGDEVLFGLTRTIGSRFLARSSVPIHTGCCKGVA